ncbi:hypothetical protein DFJ74DRAFT_423237 [Hyaloraphidium curvatum]|nr:hypothetical protein DFJ74DRAFT_423237 [Hyaloraphidium curvatum]
MDSEIGSGTPGFSLGWRIFHFCFYFLGGSTFILGSLCYFPQFQSPSFDGYYWGAFWYTLGSCGFLLVDIQEWFTFGRACGTLPPLEGPPPIDEPDERTALIKGVDPGGYSFWFEEGLSMGINSTLSLCGSVLYLVGSIGFLPYLDVPNLGIFGFIFGSAFIWVSQGWKVLRIGTINTANPASKEFKCANFSYDRYTLLVVELFAGLGGLTFFISTILYWLNFPPVPVTAAWVLGSCCFTTSALTVAFRHFVLGV